MVNLIIDGKEIQAKENTTILEAARQNGIDIPTLCFLKDINEVGDCRMCIVEVEGRKGFATSCIQTVEEGMVVKTHSPEILEARKIILDLILSNHHKDCLTCSRNGNCELQALSMKFNVQKIEYEGEMSEHKIDDKSPAIVRDFNKCILCRRCVATCKNVQEIGAIDCINRGFNSCISTTYDHSLNDVDCTFCGQCIESCPTGALKEKEYIDEVWAKLKDEESYVVVQTAPSVRVALGEEFGMDIGTNVKGKMVSALKQMGFDKVFDTNTSADFTIMEEANEFIHRITNEGILPMITSCSPGWVRFAEKNYPDLLGHLSTCKSPQQMFGALIKSYFAEKYNVDKDKIITVSVMPCIAKKYEASRQEMEVDGLRDIDFVITTRELSRMIRQANIDFMHLEDSNFDDPMGEASGAGAIFGTTGGVMEAALRTATDILEKKDLKDIEYKAVRGEKGIKEATLEIAGKEINIAVVSGLANARKIMEQIKNFNVSNLNNKENNQTEQIEQTKQKESAYDKCKYDFIEIMACPGGCVMGGGQPIKSSKVRALVDVRKLRADAIYSIDEKSIIRKSHENPVIKQIYNEFLKEPGSHISHKYLHTSYSKKEKYEI